jgi:hypothetical protein
MRHLSEKPFHSHEQDGQSSGTSSMSTIVMTIGLS